MINVQLIELIDKFVLRKKRSLDIASFGHPSTLLPQSINLIKTKTTNIGLPETCRDTLYIDRLNKSHVDKLEAYRLQDVIGNYGVRCKSLHVFDIDPNEDPYLCWDLNKPLPQYLYNQYDLAIDSGTHEHVFNIGASLTSFASLPKKNGMAIGALPFFSQNQGYFNINPNCLAELFSPFNGYKLHLLKLNCYESPEKSLRGITKKSYTIYSSEEHFRPTYDLILQKIQSLRIEQISNFNTLYYVAEKKSVLAIYPPMQRKYKA